MSAETVLTFFDEKDLECSICLKRFTDPKALECLHTYCLKCLQYLMRKHGKIRCPKCCKAYTLKNDDLKHLQCNETIRYLVEFVEKIESEKPETCSRCEDRPQHYCSECEMYMCRQCIQQHKTENHSLYTLDTDIEEQGQDLPNCQNHPDKKLEDYCRTCKLTACEDCKHIVRCYRNQHKVIPMLTALNEINQTVIETMKTAEEIKGKLNERLDVITKEKSDSESDFSFSRTAIEFQEITIIKKVKQETKIMMANLTHIYKEKGNIIDREVKNIESKLTQVTSLMDSIKKTMNKPTETENLASYQTIINAVRNAAAADELDQSFAKTRNTPKFIPSQKLVDLMNHEGIGRLITVGGVYKVNKEDENISVTKGQPFSVRVSSQAENDVGPLTATLSNSLGEKSATEVAHKKGEYTVTGRCKEGDWHMDITDGDKSHVIGSPVSIKVEALGLVNTIDNISEYKKNDKRQKVIDVVLDTDGCMLVSSCNSKDLIKFDQSGCFVSKIQIPQRVKVNRMHQLGNGHMVYSDYVDKCVVMCDNQYHEIQTFGKVLLQKPDGITVNKKTRMLYVADRECHCVFKFNIDDGSLLGKIGSEGSKPGQMKTPMDIALTKDGHVFVADCDNSRIQMFDANDKLIKILIGYGEEDGKVWGPQGIILDMDENIIASSNHKLQLFDQNGKFIKRIDNKDDWLDVPAGIAVISQRPRRVVVANHRANNVKIFNY
ncbi:tripartite motif-containing protein 2-like [Antedon mediterranea]|uniref:tripartite motif-containing protein 2-like n=1 Tax=Antedon mediterranea TaxID=105859 RepID=UPI003AF4CFF3